jgi:hypothetical protein
MTTGPCSLVGRQIPAWADTVGPGWTPLLDRLHHDLLTLDADYRVESFATKFGGLRITIADRFQQDGEFDGEYADQATHLTDTAETASEHTCETCGAAGRIRLRGNSHHTWLQTSCDTRHTTWPPPSATTRNRHHNHHPHTPQHHAACGVRNPPEVSPQATPHVNPTGRG